MIASPLLLTSCSFLPSDAFGHPFKNTTRRSDVPSYGWQWMVIAYQHSRVVPSLITSEQEVLLIPLASYLQEGYQPEMEDGLRELIETYCSGDALGSFQILPNDLESILDWMGNPLVNEDGEEPVQDPPPFDLNNPDHLEALDRKIQWLADV